MLLIVVFSSCGVLKLGRLMLEEILNFLLFPSDSSHRQQMERMNQMMAPFGGMLLDPFGATPAITNGREPQGRGPMQDIVVRHQDPFANPFGNMFGNMDRMMQDMMGNMNRMMVSLFFFLSDTLLFLLVSC